MTYRFGGMLFVYSLLELCTLPNELLMLPIIRVWSSQPSNYTASMDYTGSLNRDLYF